MPIEETIKTCLSKDSETINKYVIPIITDIIGQERSEIYGLKKIITGGFP